MVRNTHRRNLRKNIKTKKSYRNKKRNKSKKRVRRGGAEELELVSITEMRNLEEKNKRLEEENKRLKAENERLEEKNKRLEEENKRLMNVENKKPVRSGGDGNNVNELVLPVDNTMVNITVINILEEENERLKAENKRLKAENKRLKAENKRLKAENKKQSSVVKLISLPDIKVKGIEGVTFSSNDFTANLQNNHDTKSGINKYSNQGSDKYKLSQSYKKSTAREKYLKDLLNDFIKSNNIKIKNDDSTFTKFIILMHYFMGLSMKNKDNQYIDINKTLFNEKNKTKRENEKEVSILHMMYRVLGKEQNIMNSVNILVKRGYISILFLSKNDIYKDENIKNIKTFYKSYLNLDDAVKDESTN
jgi:hypothetical protein